MNTRLFRQVSLARLSSPEQLDQILRVTSSRQWVGLSAVAILLAITVIWGVSGIITTTAGGSGVLVRSGGVVNVVSSGSGTVTSLHVHVGDHVKAQQSLGLVAQPLLEEKIKSLRQTIAETEQQGAQASGLRQDTMKLQVPRHRSGTRELHPPDRRTPGPPEDRRRPGCRGRAAARQGSRDPSAGPLRQAEAD